MIRRINFKKGLLFIIFISAIILLTFPIKSYANRFNFISAGYTINSYNYEERGPSNEFLDSETGAIHGANIKAQGKFSIPFFIYGNIELQHSPSIYNGFLQPSMTPYKTNTLNTFYRFETNTGYIFNLTKNFYIAPYIGFGYYFWSRSINKGVLPGYLEHYSWLYFPFGIKFGISTGNRFSFALDVSLRSMQSGKVTAFFSRLNNPSYPYDVNVELPSTLTFNIELTINFYINERFGISLSPWYNYSSYERSNPDKQYLEAYGWDFHIPKNTAHKFGLNLNFVIYFGVTKNTVPEN